MAVERGLFPEDGKRGKKKFRFMRNNSVRKILRGFCKIIFRLSDGVVEYERMEEDVEEYINAMEESVDVDVDKEDNRSSRGLC